MSDDQTLFEQIVAGEIPSHAVYEDETTYAFLDVNPLAPGHTLVIPKQPYERLNDLPPATAADLFAAIAALAPAVEAAVDAPGSLVAAHNGAAAGQEIPHLHWHIVPRFEDDDGAAVHALFDGVDLPDERLAAIAEAVREHR